MNHDQAMALCHGRNRARRSSWPEERLVQCFKKDPTIDPEVVRELDKTEYVPTDEDLAAADWVTVPMFLPPPP